MQPIVRIHIPISTPMPLRGMTAATPLTRLAIIYFYSHAPAGHDGLAGFTLNRFIHDFYSHAPAGHDADEVLIDTVEVISTPMPLRGMTPLVGLVIVIADFYSHAPAGHDMYQRLYTTA